MNSVSTFDECHPKRTNANRLPFCTFTGASALNSQAISVKPIFTPQIANLSFILRTRQANVSIPITNPTQLWARREFNPRLPLVIFVTGWKTNLLIKRSEAQEALAEAFLCRGNVNFVVRF